MARVTVEDCVERIPNRFQLVLLAAQRARNLSRGEELTVLRDNDKNPVVALREIADETISVEKLELDLIPTDQNIFGLQDISNDEEAMSLPEMNEEMSPDELESAIEAELGGRRR